MRTYQECRDEIATRYGYKNWNEIDFYAEDCRNKIIEEPFAHDRLIKEVAELYREEGIKETIKLAQERQIGSMTALKYTEQEILDKLKL